MHLTRASQVSLFVRTWLKIAKRDTSPTQMAFWLSVVLLAFTTVILGGCEDEEQIEQDDTGPIVGLLELPISLRNEKPEPPNPIRVEISPTELRVDSEMVLALEGGKIDPAKISGDIVPALSARIKAGAARRASSVRIHVNVPYSTLYYLISTFKQANVSDVSFEVRKGQSVSVGYLDFGAYDVIEATDEPVRFESDSQRTWDEFVDGWEAAYTACRRDHYVDCDKRQSSVQGGGDVQITLFARGTAAKIELQRIGDEAEDTSGASNKPSMIDGVPPPPTAPDGAPAPVNRAAFTWRGAAITDELSPVSGAMRPLCGAKPCGAVVVADGGTMSMRVLSLIGAAFPNGSLPPELKFQRPTK